MLTLSKEKNQNNNNIWHSPSSKSNGIYTVEPVTHTTEHDAGSLSSSPLSSPDSKNMQSESQQQLDATENNFNTSSSQSSPLSELSNLNDDDQPQDQQQQSSAGSSDSSSSNLNSNPPSGLVLNQNGITDGSRHAESKTDLSAEQLAGTQPAGESTNATATVNVTSQPHHYHHQQPQPQQQQQQQRHTNINTSNSSSPSPSQHQHVNGMGVSAPLAVRDSSSSTPAPAALISTTSSTYPPLAQSNEQHSSRSSSDIPDEKVAAILLLNIELFKVCMECQTRQLMQSSEFNAYVSRLQSNLSWLAAVADQNRLKNIPLPILTPPVPLPWHPSHTINDFYQRLSTLFARDIAKRQAAAALTANPGPGGGGMPPGSGSASVAAPRSAGTSANSVSTTHPHPGPGPGPGPTPGMGVPIQPAPQNMMTAGIKRGPPTDAVHDDQTGMRKRVDTGERRHSNPPLAAAPTPPHARSPSVMSNGTGVSVAGPGAGGMGMNNMIGMQEMNMHPQTNMAALSMGMGGMSGMQAGQAHSPHSSGPAVGHPSHSPTPLRGPRNSPEVAITQQVQAGMHSPQGAQPPHGHLPQSQNPALLQHTSNTQIGFGSQGIGMSMSDVQAQVQAAQMAQRTRMLQQAQAAMQSNRPNPNTSLHPEAMKDPRMAAMMSNTGVGGPTIAPNPAMNMGQPQRHPNPTSAGQMAPAATATAPMNTAGGMSMQIQPPPSPSATMLQAIVNAFGANGLTNYQALQNGAAHPFVSYMLTHVPGFAHLPWQQQLQRMQVVQNNIRQQQQQQYRLQSGSNNMPGDQTNSRNGLSNPVVQASAISAHANQGHAQAHMDQTVASPFNRQSGSPPNVGGMAGLPSPQGQQMGSGQAHQHMSPPPGASMPTRPGTAGSQSGSGGGPMSMGGQSGAHHPSVNPGGAGPNQNITPQERQLRLMQQQMHHRSNDGVLNTVQAFTSADKVRQHPQHQGSGQQQQQQQQAGQGQGQMGMHPGAVSGQSSTAGSPPNTASGTSAPFGHPPQMGIPMNMNMNLGNNMGIGGMGIGPMGGMPNSNRSAPSPSDMISAAAAVRGANAGGVLAPNITQKRPVSNATAMQNDAYHQMALYQRQQQSHQMANAAIRPGTAMGGMNPAAMAAAAQQQQQQQQQQQHQHQYANPATSAGGGTINPGMIYGSNNNNGGGNMSGGVQSSTQSQQQAYLSQAQSAAQMSRSQSQPPFHAISPAALQHHPDGTTRIGTPGSVGGGVGGTPRPGSSASNAGSMLPTDGLAGDSLDSLFNWNGA